MYLFKRNVERFTRNNSYFILFFCIGLLLNLDLINWNPDNCTVNEVGASNNVSDNFSGSGSTQSKPSLTASPKPGGRTLIRPRYYSTELGIRDKLFVAVLTDREQITGRTTAINQTLAHLVEKVKYFMSASRKYRPAEQSLANIVAFTDSRDSLRPFHIIKYISDGFIQNYDYFLLMKDSTYVNGRQIQSIVNKISVSQNVYLGTKLSDSTFCSLDAGILLSNSVVSAIMEHLDWCLKNSFSDNHSENLGRCIAHSFDLDCQQQIQGQRLKSYHLRRHGIQNNLNALIPNRNFNSATIIYPVLTSDDIYTLHAYYSRTKMHQIISEQSNKIEREILKLSKSKLPPTSSVEKTTWPVGFRNGAALQTRFDVNKHIYFNLTHKYFHSDYSNVERLTKSERIDIENILNSIKQQQNLTYKRFRNGYRVFDLSRGLDYTLDLSFKHLQTGKELIKRFKVSKPLGQVELLPIPYVTENGRVVIFVPLLESDEMKSYDLIEMYGRNIASDRSQKTFLLFIFMYEYGSQSKGDADVFRNVKKTGMKITSKCSKNDLCKIAWLSVRLPGTDIISNDLLKFAAIDLGLSKIGADSLVLVLDPNVDINGEFLNRVKMNTISGFQIFSPIPFRMYNPQITNVDVEHQMSVHKSTGQFVENNYNYISFYGKDYVNARLKSGNKIPIVRNDRDIKTLLSLNTRISSKWNVFRLFVKHSELHCLRGTDPGIKIKYYNTNGPIASKTQLAQLILNY